VSKIEKKKRQKRPEELSLFAVQAPKAPDRPAGPLVALGPSVTLSASAPLVLRVLRGEGEPDPVPETAPEKGQETSVPCWVDPPEVAARIRHTLISCGLLKDPSVETYEQIRAQRQNLYRRANETRRALYAGTSWAGPEHSLLRWIDEAGNLKAIRRLGLEMGISVEVRTKTDELGQERSTIVRRFQEQEQEHGHGPSDDELRTIF
jgi:hypothetical protein